MQDIAIVGAGLSGLRAARRLVDAGRSVVVLEARDRVGGRTWTIDLQGGAFDVGGQWLGPTQNRARALVDELGLTLFPTWTQGQTLLDVGGRLRQYSGEIPRLGPLDLLRLHRLIARIEQMAAEVSPDAPWTSAHADLDALSVEAFKRTHVHSPAIRGVLDAAVRVIFGAEPAELSMLHFLAYLGGGGGLLALTSTTGGAQQDRVVEGAGLIASRLADGLGDRVRLRQPVLAITQDADSVTLRTAKGQVRARRCIVALPPAMAVRIDFQPPLPALRDRLGQRMAMGGTVKCFAFYDTPFWRDAGLSGEAVTDAPPVSVCFDNSSQDGAVACLLSFVVGQPAIEWSARDPDQRKAAVLAQLERWFGPKAGRPMHWHEQDWGAEPWTRGCPIGNFPPGSARTLAPILREPCGRIHWAGTETAREWAGFMEGALEAGDRVAVEVHQALGQPTGPGPKRPEPQAGPTRA